MTRSTYSVPELTKLLAVLEKHHGRPGLPPPRGPFEYVLWENACYLLPDDRRAAVFQGLRAKIGLNPDAIGNASDDALLPLAKMGGMRPEDRIARWREIADITLREFGGDLNQ